MATFQNNKKKDWFSYEAGLVFLYGKVCKGTSRNSAIFKMELVATIGKGKKLQRVSSDGLTTNYLLKFVEHLSYQTPPDSRFYKKMFTQYLNITILSSRINKFPTVIY